MKKITSILVLALTLTLAGCSSAPSKTSSNSGTSGKPADIQKIIDRGTLKVGVKVDVPKYGYKDPSTGKIEGFEIDIAKAVAKKILGDENKVDFQAVTAKTRGPLLDSGEIDMVAATFTITDERKKSYNFSDPYFTDGVGLLVKKDAGISSFKDLNGKKIGVAQSSTTKKALQEEADKQGIKVTFSEFASYPEIKTALSSGRVDCFSVDGAILLGYLDDNTKILSDKFSPQNYGIASKKDNTELAKVINETITEMKSSGDLQKLIDKWGLK
ncbi:transporter substrate-binding domain-containing protein [Clostridium folliculivorans]|uniref:Amino acid ABC transporter substrate-binding protein n=1 Tax=Clostridium folliculivorans TaxID=2886038 RepID=A0A9W5Y5I5_9CLOT|nr:transporter substrate-binding domain-containing protein [Clostridium folliculivorans]GKU26947.1 amino acid ABC transporter substrate-binding protein [Clostridium folliculivorans]GKU29211.1 amino acid ABC transporter substrate-binding protein [Clostridium folliculivorans]